MLLDMYDAAYAVKPPGFQVTAFYIGGATPHVWTEQEINDYTYPIKLPIYTPRYFQTGNLDPATDFAECLAALKRVGAPKGTAVAIDFETLINSYYVTTLNSELMGEGYGMLLYGSTGSVFQNPKPFCGYWAATRPGNDGYSGAGNLYPGSAATQFAAAEAFDSNVIESSLPLWGLAGTPIHTPAPSSNWTVNMIAELPTLKQGDAGANVATVQGLLIARGFATTVDGHFGPDTDLKVRSFQANHHVPNSIVDGRGDGNVGPDTWTALVTNKVG
jgi:Putative peptidoglycan binding domain